MSALGQSLSVILITFFLLGVESPLLQELHVSSFPPDLALVPVLWLALHVPPATGMVASLVIGLIKDGFVMGVPVGMYAEISVVTFLVARFLTSKVPIRGLSSLMITTMLLSVLASMLLALLSLLFDPAFQGHGTVLRLAGPVALVSAPFAPLVFFVLDRTDSLFARSRQRDAIFGR